MSIQEPLYAIGDTVWHVPTVATDDGTYALRAPMSAKIIGIKLNADETYTYKLDNNREAAEDHIQTTAAGMIAAYNAQVISLNDLLQP